MIAVGIGLRAWSIATLGRFFQYQIQVQPGHHVVTGGPYRYVRHPFYGRIALVLAGPAVRIRAVERQLGEAPGSEYEDFAADRKRLVPGVW